MRLDGRLKRTTKQELQSRKQCNLISTCNTKTSGKLSSAKFKANMSTHVGDQPMNQNMVICWNWLGSINIYNIFNICKSTLVTGSLQIMPLTAPLYRMDFLRTNKCHDNADVIRVKWRSLPCPGQGQHSVATRYMNHPWKKHKTCHSLQI